MTPPKLGMLMPPSSIALRDFFFGQFLEVWFFSPHVQHFRSEMATAGCGHRTASCSWLQLGHLCERSLAADRGGARLRSRSRAAGLLLLSALAAPMRLIAAMNSSTLVICPSPPACP